MKQRARGFTLLELVVAIAILAGMFVVIQETFRAASIGREQLNEEATRLEARQRALTFLLMDFEQVIARPVRDAFGELQPALMSVEGGLALTRLGWANPFDLRPRSSQQRVEYRFIDEQLIRRYWPSLDVAAGTEPVDTILLTEIESVAFRYLDQSESGEWRWLESWPDVAGQVTRPLYQPLPKSIELTITFTDGSELHRYFRTVVNPWL
ncbi:MAG: type II secretion system protein GspJ [Gammaproteobacteria bacterium HGW-Gammaproteobacteria-14]|nr:MAG: type II secretion system protein GspJ [Gammaproteobacteria bacterium HGW-Gammaproteobacteria-14]